LIQSVLVPEVVQPLLVVLVAVFLPGILFHMPLAGLFLTCRFHLMPTRLVLFQLAMFLLVLPAVAVVAVLSVFVQNQLRLTVYHILQSILF
jgi:hypothetical protein